MRKTNYVPLLLAICLGAQAAALADERCAGPQAALMSQGAQAAPGGAMARNEQDLSAAPALILGRAYDLQPSPQGMVAFVAQPEGKRAHTADTTGGILRFSVEAAGRYRVLLSSPHWVDVVSGRTLVPSVSHESHLGCEGLHKTIDYELAPGEYLLQLSGAERDAVRIAILPVNAAAQTAQ